MNKEGDLRVWWIRNPPSAPERYRIRNIKEAMNKIEELAQEDLKNELIDCNIGGLEIYENGEWCEYYDNASNDIMEIINENEMKLKEGGTNA